MRTDGAVRTGLSSFPAAAARVAFPAALVASSAVARSAEPPVASLEFDVPEATGCPSAGDLRRALAERMGYDPIRSGATTVLSIRITGPGPYRGELAVRDAAGHTIGRRTFEDADCGAVRDSLILAVLLAIDPLSLVRRSRPTPPPAPPPQDPRNVPGAPREEPHAELSRRPSSARLALRVSAGAQVFAGVVPAVAPGATASIGLRYGRIGLDVEGATTLSGSVHTDSGGAEGTATIGTVLPCFRVWDGGRAGVDLCGAVTAGALFSRGADVSRAISRTDAVLAAGARLQGDWRVAPSLGFSALAQASIPLVHDELLVDSGARSEVVWRTPAASASCGLALFALLP